ncbi:MAG: PucR family transcriptional regulator [Coprococcus sp.]|nr:PucR family transcriptional regulator [Coprococcus sp.]
MALTVREIWQMEKFQSFRLAAGREGLENEIENIGILDYEYAVEDIELQQKWAFGRKGFVISSLLFAKDHPEKILDALHGLVRDHVSALAVKTVCYQELPKEAIRFADEHAFPIFLFGRDDAYFEEIVYAIKEKIIEWNDFESQEKKLDFFLKEELSGEEEKTLIGQMIKEHWKNYTVIYEKCEANLAECEIPRKYRRAAEELGARGNVFLFHQGYLFFLEIPKRERFYGQTEQFLKERKARSQEPIIGVGGIHGKEQELRQAVGESLYARELAALQKRESVYFDKMGIYRVLIPYYKEWWMQEYSRRCLEKIVSSDRENDGELFSTLRIYVEQSGDMQSVSDKMHIHKNTVRYRINKARELLGMEDDPTFFEQIAIAIRIYELDTDKEVFFDV